jgi:phytoene synthase
MTMALNENDAYVRSVTRRSRSNFSISFFSLPKDQRQAITAVYAFCREVDDVVDLPAGKQASPGQEDKATTLARWKEELARTYEGKPSWPLTKALAQAIQRFHLSKVYFDGILQGVSMDLTTDRYPTFESLSTYCYHVASEVGLLCMEIFGTRSPHLKSYAVKLGMAFQLTNILRDVSADAQRNRIYLPQEDLKRFGVDEGWILQQANKSSSLAATPTSFPPVTGGESIDPPPESAGDDGGVTAGNDGQDGGMGNFQRLMAFEVERAHAFYQEASALPRAEEWPILKTAEIMRAVYADILDRIEARQFQVFGPRICVPAPVKLWLALQAWWRCRS